MELWTWTGHTCSYYPASGVGGVVIEPRLAEGIRYDGYGRTRERYVRCEGSRSVLSRELAFHGLAAASWN